MTFLIKRGGKRTTEEIIRATVHTFVGKSLNSTNFPLAEAPEEEWELEAFQVPEYNYEPSSDEILSELTKRGLERPTYEDALKFDEAHSNVNGVFVFLHKPWVDAIRAPRVVVIGRVGVLRRLFLGLFKGPWLRRSWFVGVRSRSTQRHSAS